MQSPNFWLNNKLIRQGGIMAMRMFLLLAMLFLFVLPASSAQGAEAWPTTKFKVFTGNPFMGDNLIDFELMEFNDLFSPDSNAIREVERALSEAAEWYKKNGFPPPLLQPLVSTDDGYAYQVYVCSPEWDNTLATISSNILSGIANSLGGSAELRWGECTGAAGKYYSECGHDSTRTSIIVINSDVSFTDWGELTELAYQTLAHELMHSIIANTPFGRTHQSCTVTHWITESLPDAISFDLAEELWKDRYNSDNSDGALIKRYGYRPYNVRLSEGENGRFVAGIDRFDFKYTTSSFWRYINDSHARDWGKLLVQPAAAPGLLNTTMEAGPYDWRRESAWFNKGLKDKFNLSLARMYGLFVNNFAHRPPPFKNYRGRPAETVIPKWLEKLFGECQNVNLASSSSQEVELKLARMSTACIWVEIGSPGLHQVSFQSFSEDESLLKDIMIGRTGTTNVVDATISLAPGSSSAFVAGWLGFQQDGATRGAYLVSNMADVPEDTQEREITLTIGRSTMSNSAMATVPLPPSRVARPAQPPSFEKHARSLTQQKRATAEMIEEQMNLDKESLNPNVDNAVGISRSPNQPACSEPFKYTACGPHLSISLELMPGTFIIPGRSNAQGGVVAQTFGGLQAMAATSLSVEAEMEAFDAALKAIDGSAVSIVIPLIDYGFTGSFNNASISVRMSGERRWSAIGPADEQQRSRLTGRVTIEEYTPFVIRGSFVAPLAEFVPSGFPDQPPIFTPRDTITGSFTSVAPWLSDERTEIILDPQQQMADEIANTLGVPADMIYSMKQDGTMPGTPSAGAGSGASSGSGGSIQTGCSCECEMKPFADELCELFCEEEFAACKSQ
jgi:hypothetical protein